MSKVDVMFPQETLTVGEQTKETLPELMQNDETAGDAAFGNENEKSSELNSKFDSDNPCNGDRPAQVRKKKHRRGKRRKWKPYSRLTWDERRELEERDSRRAHRIRAEMSAFGLPLAPYNTTQFLMEDHNLQEPDYSQIPISHKHRERSENTDSSDAYYSSPEDEEDFLKRQFIEAYEDINVERLNSMTKTELVQELMSMEDKVETLEKSVQEEKLRSEAATNQLQNYAQDLEAQLEKIRVFKEEIQKLVGENEYLRRENESLQNRLQTLSDSA